MAASCFDEPVKQGCIISTRGNLKSWVPSWGRNVRLLAHPLAAHPRIPRCVEPIAMRMLLRPARGRLSVPYPLSSLRARIAASQYGWNRRQYVHIDRLLDVRSRCRTIGHGQGDDGFRTRGEAVTDRWNLTHGSEGVDVYSLVEGDVCGRVPSLLCAAACPTDSWCG